MMGKSRGSIYIFGYDDVVMIWFSSLLFRLDFFGVFYDLVCWLSIMIWIGCFIIFYLCMNLYLFYVVINL